jgi:hypothetical protein
MSRAGFEPATPCFKVQTRTKPINDFKKLSLPLDATCGQKAATMATSGNRRLEVRFVSPIGCVTDARSRISQHLNVVGPQRFRQRRL